MTRFNVGILGATGLVGQRLIERLRRHPMFRIVALAASERSAGRSYGDVVRWRLSDGPTDDLARSTVRGCDPGQLDDCDLVFSGLDTDVAREVEPRFANAGFAVVSNSSAYRQQDDVPLVVPEINAAHLGLLEQQTARTGGGYIVTNPNCSVIGLALLLAPLHRRFGVRRLIVTTLQAISGAGVNGPRALDLVDNVLPFIPGEEQKIEQELRKILGVFEDGRIAPAAVVTSAHCHRVPTQDGHLEAVSVELVEPAGPTAVAKCLTEFEGDTAADALPSAPRRLIEVRDEPDRPQPRLDRDAGRGMSLVVGRIRPCPVLGSKMAILSHNTIRGAAGCTLLNAELLAARGLLPKRVST